MIARLARGLILLELLIATLVAVACIAWWELKPWERAAFYGVAFVLLVRLFITANNFAIAWRYRSETPVSHRLSAAQACAMFAGELRASLWSTSWAMPFKTFNKRNVPNPNGLPVLLIHGWACNSGYWNTLSKTLERSNITHHALDLEPVLADIDSYTTMIHDAIETLCRESGHASIAIVAHSMGGLAARAYLRAYGCERVTQLITLGTPHHGTALANFGKGANSRQMHWRDNAPSAWLCQLNEEEDPAVRARIVSIYSHHDNIIAPQTSSHLDGARNIAYAGIGHVALALHPLIRARVIAEIRNVAAHTPTQAPNESVQ
jgi:pimeloyl-ACP methyl ester carboxylesterase